jgi:hypothetical protein
LAGELKVVSDVADRSLALPAQLLRRLKAPAGFSALAGVLGTVFSMILRRTREPALPRMSDKWLRNHDRDNGSQLEYWRDSW